MKWTSTSSRIAGLGLTCALLWSAGTAAAIAQTIAPPEAPATLNAIDFNFVGQANLGAPFQIDSGRLAETKATNAAIRSYAHLMVTTHIPVVDALNVILKQKNITPSSTLLHGAYAAMIFTLSADHGVAFDRNYVNGVSKGKCGVVRTGDSERQRSRTQGVRAPDPAEDRRPSEACREA